MLLASNSKSISSAEMSIIFQDLHFFTETEMASLLKELLLDMSTKTILCYCVLK